MNFGGAVALVTGAGTGVGLAAVRRFVAGGCRVVAAVEKVEQFAALKGTGCASVAVLDVTQASDWERVAADADANLGGVDILFNNAGATIRGDLQQTDRELWERTLLINLTSVYLGCSAVVPGMLNKRTGAIVNNASINGLRGSAGLVAYSAAKSGVVGMTRSLALDYAAQGVRVNCICPAAIDTNMTRDFLASVRTVTRSSRQSSPSTRSVGWLARTKWRP